jgi:peptidoglycan/LPS O-acetylase OafA/YrhL
MHIGYRSDIDGLRFIAVGSVVLFHAGLGSMSGGFVGVDIFFVISGYLISAGLFKDAETQGISIARFYERRIKRIIPAYGAVILAALLAGLFLLLLPS